MNETKGFWASKTIWGNLISIAALVAGLFGIEVDAATQATIVDGTTAAYASIGVVIGQLVAIYGRIAATKKIGA